MAELALEQVDVRFPNGHDALTGITLTIADGERMALVGPSGSGKSTLLRVIAGLETPTSGQVRMDGMDVTDVPPERRDLTMVFQSYALYPHMTVRANLGFGLRMRGMAAAEARARVDAAAEALGITELLDRRPGQLSGGQRQRVALGRAIVRQPKAFLFDEPLSNLDPRLRGGVRAELIRLHARLRTTMIYVTHDQEEAMTLGERIAVLRDGRLEQVGSPSDLYHRPANTFVATFIGSPAMNLLSAALVDAGSSASTIGIRPHDIDVTATNTAPLHGRIDVVEPLGHAQIVHAELDGGTRLTVVVPAETAIAPGEMTGFTPRRDRLHFFDSHGHRMEQQS